MYGRGNYPFSRVVERSACRGAVGVAEEVVRQIRADSGEGERALKEIGGGDRVAGAESPLRLEGMRWGGSVAGGSEGTRNERGAGAKQFG